MRATHTKLYHNVMASKNQDLFDDMRKKLPHMRLPLQPPILEPPPLEPPPLEIVKLEPLQLLPIGSQADTKQDSPS